MSETKACKRNLQFKLEKVAAPDSQGSHTFEKAANGDIEMEVFSKLGFYLYIYIGRNLIKLEMGLMFMDLKHK